MRNTLKTQKLSFLGLAVLTVLAVALSAAAILKFRPSGVEAVPAPARTVTPAAVPGENSPTNPPGQDVAAPTAPAPVEPAVTDEPTQDAEEPAGGLKVVVVGDSHSMVDGGWVDQVASALGWGEVINLSAPGRGYISAPRQCSFDVCANLPGSVSLVAEQSPDLVVTFAGTADGDFSLVGPAADYFSALRDALPDADLVAMSPVTTGDDAPYWLTLHRRAITSAVEEVDGTMVDLGQPAIGDGDSLSTDSHAAIAAIVTDALTGS